MERSVNPTRTTEKKEVELTRIYSAATGQVNETTKTYESSTSGEVPNLQRTDLDAAIEAAVNNRQLNPRQIQLTAIAGSIGANGSGVLSGPLCLLIGFLFWTTVVVCIAQCQTETVGLFPLDGSFIRLAARMVDPALGVAVGWNHFVGCIIALLYLTNKRVRTNVLCHLRGYCPQYTCRVLGVWPITCHLITVALLFFLAINVYRADLFGEAEFWLALGKVLLATGLIVYTFVTMVGGNPEHDRYGFRYWRDPGPWAGTSPSTRLESFINAVNVAGFCMGGPEYISMIAGEAKDPRRTVPRAFKTIVARLIVFFIGGSLCVGILVPYNDKTLNNGASTYSGASPYVISMQRLQIPVLPSIVTAALLTSIISAGNAYTFNASRSLHALALEGQAPKIFRRLNKKGVPYIAVIMVMLLSCLAYLALGSSNSQVLNWILNFCTAATMFNWSVMSMTWIRFNAAMKAQGIERTGFLPSVSRFQPFAGYWGFGWSFLFLWLQGYSVFLKGNWKVATFIFDYGIIALAGGIGVAWKIVKRTPLHHSKDVDLSTNLKFFEALTEYYRNEREAAPISVKDKMLAKLF
ncbi:uncharacterized protein LY89DRAFT_743666 [Mollisia scopiformis]|uniref:Amino acid permease/ SLC12A domain-containing protein n=1 Tax=Mollisia scopiformis TaxID=149040 RepID=A0A132B4B7_MOLSC|nr:uncharacterized protein LY89DRAFT_743666 [Mollisia scopiformis]KUJ06754.1 hypothetical protein LY89DRAFT_743666 [Mollisia scopiformis]